MTQEDKELLLKDLCARLPYGVECLAGDAIVGRLVGIVPYEGTVYLYLKGVLTPYRLDEVKPYLRPMDDMTEEEYKEYDKETDLDVKDSAETLEENLKAKTRVRVSKWYHGNDWLNAHHFNYRLPDELYIRVTKENNPYYNLKLWQQKTTHSGQVGEIST